MERFQKEFIVHATIGIMIIMVTSFSYYFAGINSPNPFRSFLIGVGSGVLFTGIVRLLFGIDKDLKGDD